MGDGSGQQWLATYLMTSRLRLEDDTEPMWADFGGDKIRLRNVPHEGIEKLLLEVSLIFSAPDIAGAEEYSEQAMENIANTLSFVSGASCRVHAPLYLIDWNPGLSTRNQYAYMKYEAPDPIPAINRLMLDSVTTLSQVPMAEHLDAAFRWHARATRAPIAEDRFLYHWFVIEILAIADKDARKVASKCPRCGTDLVCPNPSCGHPEHRPFEKEKVRALLLRMGAREAIIAEVFELRNVISHGLDREQTHAHMTARDPSFDIIKAAAMMGEMSRRAIVSVIQRQNLPSISLFKPTTPDHMTASGKMDMSIGMPGDPLNPQIDDVWVGELSAIVTDNATGKQEKYSANMLSEIKRRRSQSATDAK